MSYRSLRACVEDLERHGQLRRIDAEVDPALELAEIQRRLYRAGGPALYFSQVRGTDFPVLCNLFGTLERAHFIFRDTLEAVRRLVELKVDPAAFWRAPFRYWKTPFTALSMLPRAVRSGPVLAHTTTLSALPQIKSWPDDGGPFITLPQVYTQDPERPSLMTGNLGMYRIQLAGNDYEAEREVGLHYQIHRGIGVHHSAALRRGESLPVNVFVGGPPAMTLSAVMPLPEGLSELTFAGALGGRRVPMATPPPSASQPLPLHAEADFCLVGSIDPRRQKPEGPFGDHLGYYSLRHDFPVMRVDAVYHRPGAIWPFTVVGRPPQEDTTFGALIHELTGPVIPTVVPGVRAVHAVDATGVHPLLLALGSERYTPYADSSRPAELLTQAHALLGQGQISLAKYLFIASEADAPALDIGDVRGFFEHLLARFEPSRDLHFHTRTTIDTLDYTGDAINEGSKLVIAALGPPRRQLSSELPTDLALPAGLSEPRLCLPGVLAVRARAASAERGAERAWLAELCAQLGSTPALAAWPLVVLCDDSEQCARSLDNFLWITFTRSDPARDVHGAGAEVVDKHWGCRLPLVIDARIKPHHAPPLCEDPEVSRRVDALAAPGGPLHGLF
ncbi:MAG: UbiD family decarboxylase [Myxococcales bacterium]|nr:UbiD family decarboxylase [Myxococcales bacterium]